MPEHVTDPALVGTAADERFSAAATHNASRGAGGDGRPARAAVGEAAARARRDRSARDLGIPVAIAPSGAPLALGAPCLDPRTGSEGLVASDPAAADAPALPGSAGSGPPRRPRHLGLTGPIPRCCGAAPAPALRGRP